MKHLTGTNSGSSQDCTEGLKAAICGILDLTEAEYAEMQYNAGVGYLEFYIPDDPAGARQLLGTRSYWGWWVMNWQSRDRVFVSQNVQRLANTQRRRLYAELHDPETLAKDIYPGRLVLELSYSQMIQSLFDTEIHQL